MGGRRIRWRERRGPGPGAAALLAIAAVAPLVVTMMGGTSLPRAVPPFFLASPSLAADPGSAPTSGGLDVSVVATPSMGPAPLVVNFSGAVTNGTPPYGINWDFGDSTPWGQGLNVTHTFEGAGTYYVVAHGYDALNQSGSDEVTVEVGSGTGALRVAVAATPTHGPAPLDTTFWANATGGSPPYAISWTYGDGGNGSSSPIRYTYAVAGSYVAEATVRDASGATAVGAVAIDVGESGTEDLSLSLSATRTSGSAPLDVELNASARGGSPPYALSVCFPSSGCLSGPANWSGVAFEGFPHEFAQPGTFTITGLVTDAEGDTAAASTSVTVGPAVPLEVRLNLTPLSGEAPLTVALAASVVGGTGPYALEWTFGDGSVGTAVVGEAVRHTYDRAGTFLPILTVTDFVGHNASVGSRPVVVTANPLADGVTLPGVGAWGATFVPYSILALGFAVAAGLLLGWSAWKRESRGRLRRQGEAIVRELEGDRGPPGPA